MIVYTDVNSQEPLQFAYIPVNNHVERNLLIMVLILCLCALNSATKYLLIFFSTAHRQHIVQKHKDESFSKNRKLMNDSYYVLLTMLYFLNYLSALIIPLILLRQINVYKTLFISISLLLVFGELLPRLYPLKFRPSDCQIMWLVNLARNLNRVIHINNFLKKIFVSDHQEVLTRDNLPRILGLVGNRCRQEEVQLLQKLRLLSQIRVDGVLIKRKNIFELEKDTVINAKMLNTLSKYYFSKILIYQTDRDNIIGYIQYKQLLGFTIGQRISAHLGSIKTNIARIGHQDTLLDAVNQMISLSINFTVVYNEDWTVLGLIKLKDIFSRLLLRWFDYDGLSAQRSYTSLRSGSLGKKDEHEEGIEQI